MDARSRIAHRRLRLTVSWRIVGDLYMIDRGVRRKRTDALPAAGDGRSAIASARAIRPSTVDAPMFSLAPGGAPGAGAAARARRRAMDRVVHQRAATPVALHVRERRDCSARSRRTAREAAARNPPSRGTARRTASPSSPARIWNRCLSPLAPTVLPPAHDVRRWGRLRLLESRENQLHGNPRRCGPGPRKSRAQFRDARIVSNSASTPEGREDYRHGKRGDQDVTAQSLFVGNSEKIERKPVVGAYECRHSLRRRFLGTKMWGRRASGELSTGIDIRTLDEPTRSRSVPFLADGRGPATATPLL